MSDQKPFAVEEEVKQIGKKYVIAKALANGTLDVTFFAASIASGTMFVVEADDDLPAIPSTLAGTVGYIKNTDELRWWNGSTWV